MGQNLIRVLSHIWDTICRDNQKSAHAISTFPPTGYKPAMTDNRKSCILNGERLSCSAQTLIIIVRGPSIPKYGLVVLSV